MHSYFPSAPEVLKIKPRLSDMRGSLYHQVTDLVLPPPPFLRKALKQKKHLLYFVGEGYMSQPNVDIKRKTVSHFSLSAVWILVLQFRIQVIRLGVPSLPPGSSHPEKAFLNENTEQRFEFRCTPITEQHLFHRAGNNVA